MFKTLATTSAALTIVAGTLVATSSNTAHAGNGWGVAAGVAGGLAAGAIIGSALSGPRYYAPGTYYAPRYYRPAPIVTYRPAPWSNAWYNYCSSKYRSFNPRTGYYLAYSGNYRFCR
ncbi:BA14K family protein [Labrenzia sp. PHM005]|uniref:BA14K family protein n=1 Tax=Labrenzia sp. PHM005 TaxID=2590016 RepID=UPI00113FC6AA|nr:BA14K family protein [Labrenzia sp. PHM005]QDG79280.1 BA14K family protein [Labrenzia sp. PHM005]